MMPNTARSWILGSAIFLTVASLTTSGCASSRVGSRLAPLPPLPPEKEKQGSFLLSATQKQLEGLGKEASTVNWKRLAWIHWKQGNALAARQALDQALVLLNASSYPPAQEVVERSSLADYYLLLGQPEKARVALADFRYQGDSAQGQKQLRRTTLTTLEKTRLDGPEPFLAPRLVLALRDQGPKEEIKRALVPRLEFALTRGPQGGRDDYFHAAILLQFHFGSALAALAATERQSSTEQVRTLSCLLWGGTVRPSASLFLGEGLPAWLPDNSLRPLIRTRLVRALDTLSPSVSQDIDISAGAILAALRGDFELAEHFAQKIYLPPYQSEALSAIQQRKPPLLSYHLKSDFEKLSTSFLYQSLLNQNLGYLVGVRDSAYQQRLLEQFLEKLQESEKRKIFASMVSSLLWKHKRFDLLTRLEILHNDPAFHVSQHLIHAETALDNQNLAAAQKHLTQTMRLLRRIAKPSHRFYQGLMAQEQARRLKDPFLLEQLRQDLVKTLPRVQITTLRNDGLVRLAGLSLLCGKQDDYHQLITTLKNQKDTSPLGIYYRAELLERLAREQSRLGRVTEALQNTVSIGLPLNQISSLITITEEHLKVPPPPLFVTTPSLQAGIGTGRTGTPALSMSGR